MLMLGQREIFFFLMGGHCFEIHFRPAKNRWNPVLASYPISIHELAVKMLVDFKKKTCKLKFLIRPIVQDTQPAITVLATTIC